MLKEMYHIPDELLTAKTEDLIDILGSPTLFHLEGIDPQPLFISTLLHGNETTGFYALQKLFKKYSDQPLPRAISLFIGNITAAKAEQRRLDTQDDYNRIWPGTHFNDSVEKDMMATVTRIMQKKKPFASIDIHNNTGKNPHYGCVNILNPHCLTLASRFSNIAVYFTSPKGVQSSAFSDFCPSLVLECGQSGDRSSEAHVLQYLEDVLALDELAPHEETKLKLYHTIARVLIPKTVSLADGDSAADIQLNHDLEEKNFHQVQPGTIFASANSDKPQLIIVNSESNEDITDEYIERTGDQLVFKKPITLSMFTTNETAIRQDCVCYFMEELRIG
ncbi:MAG: succinylglutamate desuccinylase/aspartoacylase family protein [Proteobacteria bacterium]|nr:succinylglutamate desuccinylase/aspartoacylase family protein [Pseudomonadota bacterium]